MNFSALTLGSPQCYARYDYVDQLIVQTLAPLCVVALLLISFIVHLVAIRDKDAIQRSQIITRYLTLFFFVTYLVLPSVTITIFGSFSCRSIDPENVMPGTPQYLRNDLSISCSSPRYYYGVYWAIAMIFIYPVGIISMYAYVLYINRVEIMNRHLGPETVGPDAPPEAVASRTGIMQYVTSKEIQFLHQAYEGRCWYWEVEETIRRLLLTAVLSVVTVGTLQYISDSDSTVSLYDTVLRAGLTMSILHLYPTLSLFSPLSSQFCLALSLLSCFVLFSCLKNQIPTHIVICSIPILCFPYHSVQH